jgi:hypothetical protein
MARVRADVPPGHPQGDRRSLERQRIDTDARFIQFDGAYSGQCSSANGAKVLQIQRSGAAPALRAIPNATWGLHLTDANIALGNLVGMVRHEIKRYVARR